MRRTCQSANTRLCFFIALMLRQLPTRGLRYAWLSLRSGAGQVSRARNACSSERATDLFSDAPVDSLTQEVSVADVASIFRNHVVVDPP